MLLRNLEYVPQAVSALMPTYNRARYLRAAIDSVLKQKVRPFELIVVDDGSSDSTSEILKSYGEAIKVIRKENGGKSSALNLGLQSARGEFIWIFDDDDVALPDCLEKLASTLAAHPECGFCYGSYDHLVGDLDGTTRVIAPDLRIDRNIDFRISVLERCFIFQPGMLVRRSVLDTVGPFNESLVRSQDYEMLLRITRQFSGVEIDSVVFHQRQHPGLRGSASAPVARGQVQSSWIKYDDLIFSEVYRTYPLAEYLPGRYSGNLETDETRRALLERACIMARKGMWAHSAADLKAYAYLAQAGTPIAVTKAEQAILRRFFGPFSYADSTLGESTEFFNVLRNISSRRLRWMIAAELLAPIALELSHGIRRGYVRYVLGTARKCVVFISKYLSARRRREQAIGVMSGVESR